MFDSLLIITLFSLASLLVRLLTLRLSINTKHLCLFFHSLQILTDLLKFQPPLFIKKIFDPLPLPPPFILTSPPLPSPIKIMQNHYREYGYFKK